MTEQTPHGLGNSMPAEWEPHEGTWLQCSQNKLYSRYEFKLEGIWLNEENLLCSHDLDRIKRICNLSSYPFRDRRFNSYQELTKLYSD